MAGRKTSGYDIMGAKKHGIDSIGVLYRYGTREELSEVGADYLAEKVSDILDICQI